MRDRRFTPFGSVRLQPDKTRTTVRLKEDTTEGFKVNPCLESRRMLSSAAGARPGWLLSPNEQLRLACVGAEHRIADGQWSDPTATRVENQARAVTLEIFQRDSVAIVTEQTEVHEPDPAADAHQSKQRGGNGHTAQLTVTGTVGESIQRNEFSAWRGRMSPYHGGFETPIP